MVEEFDHRQDCSVCLFFPLDSLPIADSELANHFTEEVKMELQTTRNERVRTTNPTTSRRPFFTCKKRGSCRFLRGLYRFSPL